MKEIQAKLVHKTDTQRFYELSEPILKGRGFNRYVDIVAELDSIINQRIKPEFRHLVRTDGCYVICVSDAREHIERLVFVAEKFPSGYGQIGLKIDGAFTMKTYGGDASSVYPDEVYLRHLGMINGVKIILE